jgi:hypothetical protein
MIQNRLKENLMWLYQVVIHLDWTIKHLLDQNSILIYSIKVNILLIKIIIKKVK